MRSSTSRARHAVQPIGPSDDASAWVSTRSSSRRSRRCPTASSSAAIVAGSSGSSSVASRASVRCSRTSVVTSRTTSSSKPIRRSTSGATRAPSAEWSSWTAPRRLPTSCSSAASSSGSVRATGPSCRAATSLRARGTSDAVSTRWRSTVCRWIAARCGLLRTPAHSGIHVVTTPARSRASHTCTCAGPAPSRVSRCARAALGHGSSSGGHCASECTVTGDRTSPVRAAVAAARRLSSGSLAGCASTASTSSPSCSTRPSPTERRRGGVRRPRTSTGLRATGRCSAWRARRTVESSANEISRPAAARLASSSSGSSKPQRAATSSRSARTRRVARRRVTTWSVSRTSSRCAYAWSTRPCGRSVSHVAASAESTTASRMPPRASLRSGSTR
ncbi:hypothetical protein L600_000300001000 [Isoptericola variabilis J7]|nr:hypothetical protein L600_000300001000 [Isoptericola variabilis J7]